MRSVRLQPEILQGSVSQILFAAQVLHAADDGRNKAGDMTATTMGAVPISS